MQRRDKPLHEVVQRLVVELHRHLAHLCVDPLVNDLLEPLLQLGIHLVFVEELERWPVDHQFNVDLVRPAFGVNVLVDERHSIFRHLKILAVYMVEDLDLVFRWRFGSLQRAAQRKHE